jgi:hypothetical protein
MRCLANANAFGALILLPQPPRYLPPTLPAANRANRCLRGHRRLRAKTVDTADTLPAHVALTTASSVASLLPPSSTDALPR